MISSSSALVIASGFFLFSIDLHPLPASSGLLIKISPLLAASVSACASDNPVDATFCSTVPGGTSA